MHAIHAERSELLIPFPNSPDPTDYMFRAEILAGSGKQAADQGKISPSTYAQVIDVWQSHLEYLKDHQPTLTNSSPFLWSIYLEKEAQEWHVTKISPMAELSWWDPAYNLAFLKDPPFGAYNPFQWNAFLSTYGPEPERKRILLYLVMQRLCAAAGIYKEPQTDQTRAWAAKCLDDLDQILAEIKALS